MTRQLDTMISIARILTTPLGSRVMMPEYGSRLFELIDRPITDEWKLDAMAYTYEAIEKNEQRVLVKSVQIEFGETTIFCIGYEEAQVTKYINLGFGEVVDAAA